MSNPIDFEWTDELSVGIPLIDHQHKRLFELIRTLGAAVADGHPGEVMMDTLGELGHYAATHFGTEERYFEQYNYPLADAHLAKHETFIREIQRVREEFEGGRSESSLHLLSYLAEWFTEHIAETDKEYAVFFERRDAG